VVAAGAPNAGVVAAGAPNAGALAAGAPNAGVVAAGAPNVAAAVVVADAPHAGRDEDPIGSAPAVLVAALVLVAAGWKGVAPALKAKPAAAAVGAAALGAAPVPLLLAAAPKIGPFGVVEVVDPLPNVQAPPPKVAVEVVVEEPKAGVVEVEGAAAGFAPKLNTPPTGAAAAAAEPCDGTPKVPKVAVAAGVGAGAGVGASASAGDSDGAGADTADVGAGAGTGAS